DDAHYADDGLLDFVEHLSTVASAPMLIVLLSRPELLSRRPTLAALRRANVVGLEALSRAHLGPLLAGRGRGPPAHRPPALAARAAGLRELFGRDLLTTVTDRLSSEEGQYAFVQSVVRTVAYQTQSRRDRLQRHLDVVAHLEAGADNDSELTTVIAQHLRDAL